MVGLKAAHGLLHDRTSLTGLPLRRELALHQGGNDVVRLLLHQKEYYIWTGIAVGTVVLHSTALSISAIVLAEETATGCRAFVWSTL